MILKLIPPILSFILLSSSFLYSQKIHLESNNSELLSNFWVVNNNIYSHFNSRSLEGINMIKVDSTKSTAWKKNYPFDKPVQVKIQVNKEGNEEAIYFSKVESKRNKEYPIIIKYDSNGEKLWEKQYKDIKWYTNIVELSKDEDNNTYISKKNTEELEVYYINGKGEISKTVYFPLLSMKKGQIIKSCNVIDEYELYVHTQVNLNKTKEHYLSKIDYTGEIIWRTKIVSNSAYQTILNYQKTKDGTIVYYRDGEVHSIKFIDDLGEIIWKISTKKFERINDVLVINDEIHCLIEARRHPNILRISKEGKELNRTKLPIDIRYSPMKFILSSDKIFIGGHSQGGANLVFLILNTDYKFYNN